MPLLIVQEDECSAPKDHPQSPDKTSRNHLIGIDRLAMPIDVEDRGLTRRALLSWVPQGGSPCGKNLRQIFSPVRLHDLGKEPLCMRVAIGTLPSGEQRQHISSVAPQLPRAMHSHDTQKQQSQQQALARWSPQLGESRAIVSTLHTTWGEGRFQGRQEPGLMSGSQQEQASCTVEPKPFRREGEVVIFFPPEQLVCPDHVPLGSD